MLFRVETLQAIVDEKPRKDCDSMEYGKLLIFLTREKKIYTFQLPVLEAECKLHILETYPNIMEMKGSVELTRILNHVERNPEDDIEKIGYDKSYLSTIPPLYTESILHS